MDDSSQRIVFAGTPEFAAHHLQALIDSKHQIVAVYTQPDRRAGRGKKLQSSPVKQLALEAGIPVHQPVSLKDPAQQQQLAALQADVLVVVAYGLLLPPAILETPAMGCLNVHASLLPRWRGAAPIQRAIESGDSETGITIMQMDAGLDTGDMLVTVRCAIGEQTTAADLHDELMALGAPLLLQVLNELTRYQASATVQSEDGATYAGKILKAEAEINWNNSAELIHRMVCAFNPFPVAYTGLAGQRLKIQQSRVDPAPEQTAVAAPGTVLAAQRCGIRVQCGEGVLTITHLQLPGGKALSAEQMLHSRSRAFAPGTCLGSAPQG